MNTFKTWLGHLGRAVVAGVADSIKSTLKTSSGSAALMVVDPHALLAAAIGGFAWAFVDYLSANPWPTAEQAPVPVAPSSATPPA